MSAPSSNRRPQSWTISGAEDLIQTLPGIVSVRVVAKPGGEVEEIHVLTTELVTPKQTVRNIESALLAHFDLSVDHRKVSVAQAAGQEEGEPPPPLPAPLTAVRTLPRSAEDRILFAGFQAESRRAQIDFHVDIDWRGQRHRGSASGADLHRARLETVANAAVSAVESALGHEGAEISLSVDGVRTVEAFDRLYAFVAVHAAGGARVTPLSGSAVIEDSPEASVILATLQATDRWVRGQA